MIRAYSVEQIRAAEAVAMAGLPPGALMQRAGAALAVACAGELRRARGLVTGSQVVLLVGSGNNGGDALVAGDRLRRRGAAVSVVRVDDRHLDLQGARRLLARADLVIDGIVGIGARAGLRGVAGELAGYLVGCPARVVAVDLPSGVDPETGQAAADHLRADLTVTFGAYKNCLLTAPAADAAGRVELVDIGLDLSRERPSVERLTTADLAARWPQPGPADHKYSRGVLGVVAGSLSYPGAAVLTCSAAVLAGAGMVRLSAPAPVAARVLDHRPEVVPGPGRVDAYVLGPGIDPPALDGEPRSTLLAALDSGLPCVVDAGALGLIQGFLQGRTLDRHHVLTPHAGELSRLIDLTREQIEAAPLAAVRRAVEQTGATVVLKGHVTVIASPGAGAGAGGGAGVGVGADGAGARAGAVRAQADAPAWLATAGTGDVLAGVIGMLLAAGLDPLEAASVAVAVHGRAAWLASGSGPIAALAVAERVPLVVGELLR